jgi:nucleotide-binding universal stress UspA family protein
MTRKVIAGYNGSDEARDAIALGKALSHVTGATLILAAVEARHQEMVREQLEDAAAGIGIEPDVRVITARSPAHGLHDLAEREAAEILVVGSSHRGGIGRVLAGSVAERVLHAAPCAVAVAPRGFRGEPQRAPRVIAVGFDGMLESRHALAYASEIAQACGAALRLVAVQEADLIFGYRDVPGYDGSEVVRSERERLEKALDEALQELPRSVRPQGSVTSGSAAEVLAGVAANVDLLVVGSRGYGPLRRVLLGGVSTALARSAPCPLLIVPRPEQIESAEKRDHTRVRERA